MKLNDADWPTFGWTTDMRPALADARQERQTVVLGTLTRVDGPSPRPVGSQMVLRGAAATGYFSGGCLEADVANHACEVLEDGAPRRLVYGHGSPWIDIRLLCGGTIEILLERIAPDEPAVADLLRLADERRPAWWSSDGRSRAVESSAILAGNDPHRYVLRHDPRWRVIVAGGDPIALAIASLANTAGFETTLIRPDGPAGPPPIEGVAYMRDDVTAAVRRLRPDRWTALISATHDDNIDDPALIEALRGDTAYVGVLGAAARIAARRDRLLAAGLPATRIATLHAPIGALRSGKAPWEVAVSVIGEIMQTRTDQAAFDADDDRLPRLDTARLAQAGR
jgi:xanthine dehydrogenase accessory factor